MNKVSVIMPIYNAERYLAEALISVLNQTLKDIEIICLDDNSTDNSVSIIEQFIKLDNRIKLVRSKEKVGAAILRNKGILEAKGKYLSFLDGDDVFDEQMLEKAYYLAEEDNLDIVIYQYKTVNSENVYSEYYNDISISYKNKYCQSAFKCIDFLPIEMRKFMLIKPDKLFRRQFIVDNKIEFQSLSSCNDVAFCALAFMMSNRNRVLEDNKAYYINRNHSELSRISYHRDPMCIYEALLFVENNLKKLDLLEKYRNYFFYLSADMLSNSELETSSTDDEKENFRKYMKKSGINNLISESEGIFVNVDDGIKNLFIQLLNNEKLSCSVKYYIIESLIDKIKKHCIDTNYRNGKVILWGIGKNAKLIMKCFGSHNIKIDYLVDKRLTEINGEKIYRISEIKLGKDDLIIPSGKIVYNEICAKYDNVLDYFAEFM